MSSMLLFALLISTDPAVPSPSNAPQPGTSVEKPKKERKICRVPPETTGTRLARRVCLSETDWALREEGRSADDMKTMGSN